MKGIITTLLTAALTALPVAASAQEYPNRPIRVICPYGAGGAADIVARAAAQELAKLLGQSVVVENRTGAGATIGAGSTITRDAPDGQLTLERSKQLTLASWKRPVKPPRD